MNISHDLIIQLTLLLPKRHKTPEDLKAIQQIIKLTPLFSKVFEQYEQSLNNDGIQKICNLLKIEEFKPGQVILKEGDLTNHKMYLLLKGRVFIYQSEKIDDFTNAYLKYIQAPEELKITVLGMLINMMSAGETFGEKATFKESVKRTASVVAKEYCICLVIVKTQFDEIFKISGEFFQKKYQTLCRLINGLGDMSSKKTAEILISQFEDVKYPVSTSITSIGEQGEYIYFLATGVVSLSYQNKHVCNLDSQGIFGDELLKDPDSNEESNVQAYIYETIVKSSYCLVYRCKIKAFQKLFPYRINKFIFDQFNQKQIIRDKILQNLITYEQQSHKQKKVVISPKTKEETKQQLRDQDKIDKAYQNYETPKYIKVLKMNKQRLDMIHSKTKDVVQKITINQFVTLSRNHASQQMELLQKVENPYDFASNVNAAGFLKQYYANLIRVGLVKPPPVDMKISNLAVQRSRINSALKMCQSPQKKPQSRRTQSASTGYEPQMQITSYQKEHTVESNSICAATPRTLSTPNPLQNTACATPLPITACSPQISTQSQRKQFMFRPMSGYLEHSEKLNSAFETNKRLRKHLQV